jgi:Tol biopolymer transport system component
MRDTITAARAVICACALAAACGSPSGHATADAGLDAFDSIVIEPAGAHVSVPLDGTVTTTYAVYGETAGVRTDITARCALGIDPTFGAVAGPNIKLQPHGGKTSVSAVCGARSAATDLFVTLTGAVVGAGAPANAADLFTAATPGTDPARAPTIEYPIDHAVSPVNMPSLELQWTAAGDDLFHANLASAYAAIDVYAATPEAALAGLTWTAIAYTAAGGDLTITVEGLAQAAPTSKFAGAPITLTMSRDAIDQTAIYYWASSQGNIMSQTFGSTDPATQVRGDCTSCHSLSRAGTRLGYSRCVGNDCNQLYAGFLHYDGTTATWTEPVNANDKAIHGSYTTFAPIGNPFPTDAQSLAIVSMINGTLALYDPDTGAAVASNLADVSTHGPGAPRSGLMADWSPDGASVVYASSPNANQWIDLSGGAIAKLGYTYSGGTHAFGEPQFLVQGPLTLGNGTYTNFFFPSFSADGALIVFNAARAQWRNFSNARTAGQRLMLTDAAGTWISDLAALNGGDADYDITWPHWAPGDSTDYYWVVFASERDYGHKLTLGNTSPSCVSNGVKQCKQIWIGAIKKAALAAGGGADPSAPPMWMPGQNFQTNNISPFWTARPPVN